MQKPLVDDERLLWVVAKLYFLVSGGDFSFKNLIYQFLYRINKKFFHILRGFCKVEIVSEMRADFIFNMGIRILMTHVAPPYVLGVAG